MGAATDELLGTDLFDDAGLYGKVLAPETSEEETLESDPFRERFELFCCCSLLSILVLGLGFSFGFDCCGIHTWTL